MPTPIQSSLDFQGTSKALNLLDPTNAQDAATKIYVDNSITNINNGMIVVNEFTALTTSAGNWAPNDILIRFQITTNAGAITSTVWYTSNGTTLVTIPIVGTDVEDLDKTRNSRLSSIDTKTPALGQALAVGSTPVVLTAAQITTLTPLSNPLEPSLTSSGSIASINGAVTLNLNGQYANAVFQISGTWTGTLVFEASNDNFATQFTTINALRAGDNTISQAIVDSTINDLYRVTVSGFGNVRVRASTAMTGSAAVIAIASTKTSGVFLNFPLPAGANTIGAVNVNGTVPVSLSSDADSTSTGTLAAAAQTVTLIMGGKSAVGIVITGTWAGTITFEGSVDGTNWNSINAVAASTSTPQSTTVVNGLFRLTPAGLLQVRANMTAFTSGTATLTMRASAGTGGTFANQIVPTTLISNPPEGLVSTGNSSVVNLAGNAVFTGTAEDVTNYASIKINVYSSHVSATNGLSYQQSHDGVLWFPTDNYTIPALTQKSFSTSANIKFFRVVYTNGATATTQLVIQTLYHKSDKQPSSVRPQDGRANDNDFSEGLAFLMGYNSVADAWNRVGVMAANVNGNETLADKLKVNASLRMIDTAQAVGSQLVGATGTQAGGLNVNVRNSSNLVVTATGVSGAAVTLTLPAVAAQFHYITSIDILIYATAARTGAATPLVVTTTNITGAPAFTFETAQAIGTNTPIQKLNSSTPLKSTTINTATTIVAPIATAGIWRMTVTYFTGT